ncbi:MAG TPA: HNH endonuclease signature motif containing protein [Gemmataceae bacterium]|nr:HNH endonuclease signature motif containing protein [Gemmataceae bacterium]
MKASLEKLVWTRARRRCEYCQMPQEYDELTFEIDHIIPQKHRGKTSAGNLALACFSCNKNKLSDLSGIDPKTRRIVRIYHPRRMSWIRHFRWDGPWLVGRSAVGRATIVTLNINAPLRVRLRNELIASGEFPPSDE